MKANRIAFVLVLAGLSALLVALPASAGDECGPIIGSVPTYGVECAVGNGAPPGPPQAGYNGWAGPVNGGTLNSGGSTGVFYCDDVDVFIPFLNPNGNPFPTCYGGSASIAAAGHFVEFRRTTDPETNLTTIGPYVITCMWGRPLWFYTLLFNAGSKKGKVTGSIMGWCTSPISMISVELDLTREGVNELFAFDYDPLDAYAEKGGSCADCTGRWKARADWTFTGNPNGFWVDVVPPCRLLSYWVVGCSQTENFTRGSGAS